MTTGEAELRALVERQRGLYGQLDALSQRQRSLAEAGEAERLLAVVQERGPLVAALSANGARIGELVAQGAASDPGLARDVDALRGMASRIAERDAEDRRLIESMRDAMADELAGLRRGRAAVGAYGGAAPAGAVFQDRKA